jgi:hypothetical protein
MGHFGIGRGRYGCDGYPRRSSRGGMSTYVKPHNRTHSITLVEQISTFTVESRTEYRCM